MSYVSKYTDPLRVRAVDAYMTKLRTWGYDGMTEETAARWWQEAKESVGYKETEECSPTQIYLEL